MANTFSDAFAGTLGNWTQDQDSPNWTITGGDELQHDPSGGWTEGVIRYSNQSTGEQIQYAKIDPTYYYQTSNEIGLVLRSEASTGYKYTLTLSYNGALTWNRRSWDLTGSDQIDQETGTGLSQGDTIAVTVQGTGTSTEVKVWANPTNDTPYDKDNWDGASDAADYTLTDGSSVLASNPADDGQFVGCYSYSDSSGGANRMDNFFGGGIASGAGAVAPTGGLDGSLTGPLGGPI